MRGPSFYVALLPVNVSMANRDSQSFPVNVNPSDPLAALAEAGAARISLGGGVHNWMMGELERRARRLLAGDATAFA